MDDVAPIRALARLTGFRDELVDELATDLDEQYRISETAHELDRELAEHNHAAVVQGVEYVVGMLRGTTDDRVHELVEIAGAPIGDETAAHRPSAWAGTLRPAPTPTDPSSIEPREPEGDEGDGEVEQEYQDAVREALQDAVDAWAWHLRHLLDHAADLSSAIIDHARTGDPSRVTGLLAQRDDIAHALELAAKRWEIALAADMENGSGPTWQLAAFEQWLTETTQRRRQS